MLSLRFSSVHGNPEHTWDIAVLQLSHTFKCCNLSKWALCSFLSALKTGKKYFITQGKVLISYEVTYTISILYSRDADNSITWVSHGFVSHGLFQFVSLITLCGSYFEFPQWLSSSRSTRNVGDAGSIPGSGRSLEKEMATYSSVLPWEIPWTEEPGGLQSMGSQKSRTWHGRYYLCFIDKGTEVLWGGENGPKI